MHCWYSSGGIAQNHVNCLLHKFIANNIQIEYIEEFIREVRLPIGNRIGKSFLSTRMSNGGAFRGYAGECIDAMYGISLFVEYALRITEKIVELIDDVRCFRLLMSISDMLATRSPLIADALDSASTEYHIHLYALYPDACKIKLHFDKHTPDDIRKWQRILTCFGPEAAHKFTNQVMLHAYKRSTYTATSYALHHAVSASQNPFTYREEYLSGKIRTFEDNDAVCSLRLEAAPTLPFGFIPTQIRCSRC